MLLLSVVLTPVFECFDRWDAPGLGCDTEFAVFAILVIVCLLLAVCKLLRERAYETDFEELPAEFVDRSAAAPLRLQRLALVVIPSVSPPLRI